MKKIISLLPGPVMISSKVSKSFAKPAISHRSPEFSQLLKDAQHKLQILTKARNSTVMMGSGTLANEAIAAQLSQLKNKTGLILSNGEFGERLIDQAERFGIRPRTIKKKWGQVFNYQEIEQALLNNKIDWIWFVHCETSSGIMNDMEEILRIAKKSGAKVCVDCISSIGIYSIDLSKIYLASASSNKGLESFSGLAIILHNHQPKPNKRIPKYLDIGFYHQQHDVPFTSSSNLLQALDSSLDLILENDKFKKIKKLSDELTEFLSKKKIKIIASNNSRSVAVTTIEFNQPQQSEKFGEFLSSNGFLTHYRNHYLLRRNWVQISFFSNSITHSHLQELKKLITKFWLGANH